MIKAPDDNENSGGSVDPTLPAPVTKKDKGFLYFGIGVALVIVIALVARSCGAV